MSNSSSMSLETHELSYIASCVGRGHCKPFKAHVCMDIRPSRYIAGTVLLWRRRTAASGMLSICTNLTWHRIFGTRACLFAMLDTASLYGLGLLLPPELGRSNLSQNRNMSAPVVLSIVCTTAVSLVFDHGYSFGHQRAAANSNVKIHQAIHQEKLSIESTSLLSFDQQTW
jgi:hypothetical protein